MPPLVYLCCAPEDEDARARLVIHLTPHVRAGELELWPLRAADEASASAEDRRARRLRAEVVVPVLSPSWIADGARCEGALSPRQDGRLVPLLYRTCPWNHPSLATHGLALLNSAPLATAASADDAWDQVATRLADDVKARRDRRERGTPRRVLSAAQRLNRGAQWHALLTHLATAESSLLLLFGHYSQSLGLFADRIIQHLETERPDRPRVVLIRHQEGRHRPRSAGEWMTFLTDSLVKALDLRGTHARLLLRAAAQERPLFLILGSRPLQAALTDAASLCDFLGALLPETLHAAAPVHPIRCLVIAERLGERDRALIDDLQRAAVRARTAGLAVYPLEEPRTPERRHVEELLDEAGRSQAEREAVLRAFDALMDAADGGLTFERITEVLDRADGDDGDDEDQE